MMVASVKGEVIYPVVVVLVDGIKVRALLVTGSGSSYMLPQLLLIGFQNDQLELNINGLI